MVKSSWESRMLIVATRSNGLEPSAAIYPQSDKINHSFYLPNEANILITHLAINRRCTSIILFIYYFLSAHTDSLLISLKHPLHLYLFLFNYCIYLYTYIIYHEIVCVSVKTDSRILLYICISIMFSVVWISKQEKMSISDSCFFPIELGSIDSSPFPPSLPLQLDDNPTYFSLQVYIPSLSPSLISLSCVCVCFLINIILLIMNCDNFAGDHGRNPRSWGWDLWENLVLLESFEIYGETQHTHQTVDCFQIENG